MCVCTSAGLVLVLARSCADLGWIRVPWGGREMKTERDEMVC